jgi:hypothetical protein
MVEAPAPAIVASRARGAESRVGLPAQERFMRRHHAWPAAAPFAAPVVSRTPLVALALLAALAATGPVRAALDPTTDRQVGGVFSNACGDRSQVMIRLYGDTLDVERGGVAVKASKLKSDRKAPAGPPIADLAATVRGQAKGGAEVALTITHNAKGLFARIDGSEPALAPLGAGVVGQQLRHCDPNRNALPGTLPPGAASLQYPADLLKDARFKAAYTKALGPLAKEPWLTSLTGPSSENRPLKVAGTEYTLASNCKPHDCHDHNLVLLWHGAQAQVYGLVHQQGRQTLIGAPPPALASELPKIWAREFRR